ncbi:MAG: molybdopterin converting factor subunit 1 [Rhodobiaceae bacterium]|nr:molybdopterin converting factor subunit 1 [Rhodobiaceae bacterium]MCC0056345.1 molybdopterin converting factor subunit 1 [Rhodobiaceae bacterium]
MKLLYFAWVRERIGKAEEEIAIPAGIETVSDLIAWLAARDEGGARAFNEPEVIRAAIDRTHASHDMPLAGAQEVAFFPPMTGG